MPRRKSFVPHVTIREKGGKTYLRYRDPFTGKEELRLVKGKYESEWQREAGAWENELKDAASRQQADKARQAAEMAFYPWPKFRDRFSDEHLTSLARKTDLRYQTVFNAVEAFHSPRFLVDIDASYLSRFQSHLRACGLKDDSISSTLAHLKVALNWARTVGLLLDVPKFPKIKRARRGQRHKPMKGRPITPAEFAAMLKQLPKAVPATAVPKWERFIKALWWGGLRLEEALELHWDRPDKMRVDLDSLKFPVLRILSSTEKGGKDRVYPISPEFAAMLRETPVAQRRGLVFPLQTRRVASSDIRRSVGQVGVVYASQRITKLGELAGVVTHVDPVTGDEHHAGAHDLRRTFGTRWSRIVKPLVLKDMMRHESLDTTLDYYVDLDADEVASDIWSAWNESRAKAPAARKTTHRKAQPKRNESGE